VSSVSRFNRIADIPDIEFDVRTGASTQVDAAEFFSRVSMHHLEKASGNLVDRVRRNFDWLKVKLIVLKLNRAKLSKKDGRFGNPIRHIHRSNWQFLPAPQDLPEYSHIEDVL
jgi:hypothetical protein